MDREPVIEVIDDQMSQIYRRMTPAQRLAGAHRMWCSARRRLEAQLMDAHPEWRRDQLNSEIRRRMIGSDGIVNPRR
jgi:hypothetical protein